MAAKTLKAVAIIPARGGSKGIPKKNIQTFLDKPLIVHSIEYALEASRIDKVFVSTDDEEIAKIGTAAGAGIIRRPAELAADTATTESAIAHALEILAANNDLPEIIILLQATSPLRPKGSLDAALEKFMAGSFDSLLSVSPTHRFFWKLQGEEAIPQYDYLNRPRRQDMEPDEIHHIENGSLYIFTRTHFEQSGNRLGGRIGHVVFDEEYSLEIDNWTDFKLLEEIATRTFN